MLIRTAKFDSKALLGGNASAIEIGVGISSTDKITLKIKDIGSSKLFRSTIVKEMNDYFANNLGGLAYYQTQQQLDKDIDNGGCKSLTQICYLFYTLQNFSRTVKF